MPGTDRHRRAAAVVPGHELGADAGGGGRAAAEIALADRFDPAYYELVQFGTVPQVGCWWPIKWS